jgi:large subunit ribosomal protein L22
MKATLTNYKQSPRKVRLVTDLIKGKSVEKARLELSFLAKRAAEPILELLNSAVANAKQNQGVDKNLIIKNIEVNKGIVLKRFMPRARGSASRINKRTSHVVLILGEAVAKKAKASTKAKK